MIRVATFNVQSLPLMRPEQVRQDVRLAAKKADVILWQEIKPKSYKDVIRALGSQWEHYIPKGTGHNGPISWRKALFTLEDKGAELLHPGTPKVCEDRGITYVRLCRKGTKREVVFVNTHYVPRAWHQNGSAALRSDKSEAATQPMRQEMWNEGNEKHRAMIAEWIDLGYAVIGGGDFNRGGDYPVVGTKYGKTPVKYIDLGGGLDYIFSINGDTTRVQKVRAQNFKANSDHMLKVSSVNLRRIKR